ncbi:MAG TPA: alkaline phosphatase PhoX, partial [Solirubrobacterales bacterium]|nr:alkaline phosphatase PhoX [Solirubrobacterales bacterium]
KFHAYDRVARGGVTSSLFDTDKGKLLESGIVLNGTHENCNGGHTPWGSWLSCEENTEGPTQGFEKPHGYVFEVPKGANRAVEPVPIKAMGRMEHEAAAIDPRSGVVYLTEDNGDPADGFYRYLPNDTRHLHKGGVLQMLAVQGRSKYDTTRGQKVGQKLHCEWVTIDDPDPPEAETEPAAVWRQGRAKGAAQFIGVEGCHWAKGSVYFVASEGGDEEEGQIWRYTPHGRKHGTLVLLYESTSEKLLDEPDTITVSPRGGVLICEDGNGEDEAGGDNYLRVLSPRGKLETFARNDTPLDLHRWEENKPGVIGRSEWSGSTYSPDGKWLFVHIQYPGRTFAITGPWEKGWG